MRERGERTERWREERGEEERQEEEVGMERKRESGQMCTKNS